jgi:hypothetical protein
MIANLAIETGIAPHELLEESPRMLYTLQAVIRWRAVKSGDPTPWTGTV